MRLIAVLLLRAAPAVALLGASTASTGPRLTPEISFQVDDDDVAFDADDEWRSLARKAAGLQQLDCSEDLLGATTRMLDEAEEGDSLAMAALGSMCTPRVFFPLRLSSQLSTLSVAPVSLSQTCWANSARRSATSRGGCTGSRAPRSSARPTRRR